MFLKKILTRLDLLSISLSGGKNVKTFYCASLCFIVFCDVLLRFIVFYSVSLCFIVFHGASLSFIVFYYASLCFIVFHCVSL